MPKFLVAALVATFFLLAGPAAASAETTPQRPVFGNALIDPATPEYTGREKIIGPAILGVVAVRVILKQVVKKGTRLKRGVRRVAKPRVRPKLSPTALRKLVSEARSFSKRGSQLAKVTWGNLAPTTQGCIVGVAVSKAQDFPKGPDLVEKIEYYGAVNRDIFKYWQPFGTAVSGDAPAPVTLAREFSSVALSTLGACAAGAALNSKFQLPPGF